MMTDRVSAYLAKRADLAERPLVSGALEGVDQAVVIPVLAEKGYLRHTLESLAANPAPDLERTIVICVVNNRTDAGAAQVAENLDTLTTLDALVRSNERAPLRLAYVDAASAGHELSAKEGVGLARKIGMDWALHVLDGSPKRLRIILSLDADTRVKPNYLAAVRNHFETHDAWAAVVDYAHPLDGPPDHAAAIVCYELYLRYHELALRYAGSPYAYAAIGSTMVCRDEAYAAVGGMNRRQGGEDFYFLQQLAKTGGVTRIRNTTVCPSGRPSERAPLGTGQRVLRYLSGTQDEYQLYNPECYRILKSWLALACERWDSHAKDLLAEAGEVNEELRRFLRDNQFVEVWERLRKHSKTAEQMRQQFHGWFDGFRTLKMIHHLRDNGYPQQEMFSAIATVLGWLGGSVDGIAWDELRHNTAEQRRLLECLRTTCASPT
ncbi:MAG: glycosyltransferase family 2 protein [Candidatus Hydrogenedentes bacterium]|nr:glycosyltransferase family 2 protein [Candidatus Hydrogenedentota bacterium]